MLPRNETQRLFASDITSGNSLFISHPRTINVEIILKRKQHFPLYRESDANCNETDEAPHYEKLTKFKEKWDCLSQEATDFVSSRHSLRTVALNSPNNVTINSQLLTRLHPRVVFSGHTHHGCHTVHRNDIHEYTIPSFNWRNKPNPSFSMVLSLYHFILQVSVWLMI